MVPNVGAYVYPAAGRVPQLLYEWADEVRYRQRQLLAKPTAAQVATLLAHAHHRLVAVHPFTNGRTARLVRDLLAYSYGYQAVVLCQRARRSTPAVFSRQSPSG
jgi:cell filamentation protein